MKAVGTANLPVGKVAKLIGLAPQIIRRAADRGRIRSVRVGKHRRFSRADVIAFARSLGITIGDGDKSQADTCSTPLRLIRRISHDGVPIFTSGGISKLIGCSPRMANILIDSQMAHYKINKERRVDARNFREWARSHGRQDVLDALDDIEDWTRGLVQEVESPAP